MDTREQTLIKLTRLHDESHPTPHRPANLRRNYSLPVGASWNLRWTRVGDDEERRSPSPEPQMDSRFALPSKNRAWRWLRLVDPDNSFSLIFSGNMWIYSIRGSSAGPPGGYNPPGCARRGGRALVGCAQPGAPLWWVLAPEIFIIDIKNPRKVSFHYRINHILW